MAVCKAKGAKEAHLDVWRGKAGARLSVWRGKAGDNDTMAVWKAKGTPDELKRLV